jgi:hypothetical protein
VNSKQPDPIQGSGFSTEETAPRDVPTARIAKSRARMGRFAEWRSRLQSMFVRRLLIVGLLSVMILVGLFLSNYSSDRARYYWFMMFPIFGIACLAHELSSGRAYEIALWRIIARQVLHWLGPVVAVEIMFLQHGRGQMSTDAVALVIVLLLAVTCFLAGVHLDWSFYWVSAFLALAAVVGTEIETYIWLAVVLLLLFLALALASAIYLHRGSKRRQAEAQIANPPAGP